jgi:hypothetical protein
MDYKETIENVIKYGGIIGGLIAFFKSLKEYQDAQKWKKAEFLAKEAKEFFADKNVSRSLLFLDYKENDIAIYENELEGVKTLHYDSKLLINSLDSAREITELTEKEKLMRKIFDDFLTKLGFFNNYVETKLIKIEDLKPYLEYWLIILANPQKSKRNPYLMKKIWAYIDKYGQTDVRNLVTRFGFEPNFIADENPKDEK